MASKLLISEHPVSYLPTLAKRTSVNAAILAQQIYYWQNNEKVGRVIDGERWVYNSYQSWADQLGLTPRQVEGAVKLLEESGALQTCTPLASEHDHTKHYRIDPNNPLFLRIGCEIESRSNGDRITPERDSSFSSSETTTETTTPSALFSEDVSPSELEILNYLKHQMSQGSTFKFDYEKHLAHIRELTVDFPELELLSVMKELRAWNLDQPKSKQTKERGWLNRMRNFCKTSRQYGKNRKALQQGPQGFDAEGGFKGMPEDL